MTAKREPKQSPGAVMVAAIVAEMAEAGLEPDSKETILLDTARKLLDRLSKLEQVVEEEGLMVTSNTGVVKVNPAAIEARQLAGNLARVLSNVVVSDSSAGKNPTKQKAAQTRWRGRTGA